MTYLQLNKGRHQRSTHLAVRLSAMLWLLAAALWISACAEGTPTTIMALDTDVGASGPDAVADAPAQTLTVIAPSPTSEPIPVADAISSLTISPPIDQPAGRPVIVDARLVNALSKPLPNKVLQVRLNGETVRRIRTDEDGAAEIYLGRDLPVGGYAVEVEFIGTAAYLASQASDEFIVRPARLTIETVPPLPGIGFVLNGKSFYSGDDGIAYVEVDEPGVYDLEMLALPEAVNDDDALIEFERWADGVFTSRRDVKLKDDKTLYVGLSRSYLVDQAFVDLDGNPIDPERIGALTLKSSHGTRYTYSDGRPRWRTANRIARLSNGLEATEIQYAVESVIVDGSNVVNKNQQRFTVTGKETWTVELLLYNATVQAADAIFGFPLGSGVRLDYPDGSSQIYYFDGSKTVDIRGLARGMYALQVLDVRGMAPETPVVLSRDQDVVLKVLSAFDMGLGVSLGILGALGLLIYGRPQLIGRAKRRTRPALTPRRRVTDQGSLRPTGERYAVADSPDASGVM